MNWIVERFRGRHARAFLGALAMSFAAVPAASGVDGWASMNGGTTGGAGGPTVSVSNETDLKYYAGQTGPYVIQIQGTIALTEDGNSETEDVVFPTSNKTFIGLGTDATVIGGFKVKDNVGNVIFQRLTISNVNDLGEGDGITVKGSIAGDQATVHPRNIWIDHCNFVDNPDGQVDCSRASDYITISWCKFYYTFDSGHNFVNLTGGAGDEDYGDYRIAFHHNWWGALCDQRMPAQRFGSCHMYNNYFSCTGNEYCSCARVTAHILSENNYYDGVEKPLIKDDAGFTPKIKAVGNTYNNCTGEIDYGTDTVFTPPYSYSLYPTGCVPTLVMAGAGVAGVDPTPDSTPPAAPTGLRIRSSDGLVALDWTDNTEQDLQSYSVKRSTTPGGPYTTIASDVRLRAFSDYTVVNDTPYYYVLSAVDRWSNESTDSSEVGATPETGAQFPAFLVNCGGDAASPFTADAYHSLKGSDADTDSHTIDLSAVTDPAPTAVYRSDRRGRTFNYTFPGLTPGLDSTVRLHFSEYYFSEAGRRVTDVSINGTLVLDDFDVYAEAGAKDKAIDREFATSVNGDGQIAVGFAEVVDKGLVCGIEVWTDTPPNPAPTPTPTPLAAHVENWMLY
ncbi:hypothetical protein JW916_12825 [Candidatus Sumerlaeota bacterium]|nr:hypothetical protein [Candidatus Sumerlaeota bacterium]